MQRMDGRRLETELFIESARPIVLRMDEDRPDSGYVGGLKRAEDGVLQHPPADPFVLMRKINGHARQDHHRNGMPRQPLPDARLRGGVVHCPHGQAIITEDLHYPANDKSPRCICPLIQQCIALQPVVEHSMPAIETVAVMFI